MGDVSMATYYPHRWVTESANNVDGSGKFGQSAQRAVVVQSMQAMLNSNQDIRDDESRVFNLMATPGYPELIGEMISLNNDRGLTAFIVGDSPATLDSSATSINEWGTNVNLAVEDNANGLTSRDEYLGVYYPWGFTSDNAGNNVVVPPSHMMLRTIALSDQVSFPWFAPAGTRRGGITNATATGYIDNEGEFVSIALNEGQRDTLFGISVNPITFITGAGLVCFGQKTRAKNASALDRVNVARLVIYMRSQLNKLAKPYIFEPNDKITRDEIKNAAESLMLELVGSRALYDYIVVCDESNNTPSRIDRNELYLDIAIEPVKAVEFIYIPLRLKNTGEIAGL
jgi:phage tail sheath protein FI